MNVRVVSCIAIALSCPAGATAQGSAPPFAIRGSEVRAFHSQSVGQTFELHTLVVSRTDTTSGLPLVLLLDSDEDFPLVSAIGARMVDAGELTSFVLLGVGYPESPRYFRSRDYTPSEDPASQLPTGGAEAFLRFLAEELLPWAEERFEPSGTRVLMGHSLGGLLAMDTAIQRPDLFTGFVASSPSVWWGDEEVVRRVASRGWPEDVRLYTSLGEKESELMRGAWDRMTSLLDGMTGARAERLTGETHASAKPVAYSHGLRWALRDAEDPS